MYRRTNGESRYHVRDLRSRGPRRAGVVRCAGAAAEGRWRTAFPRAEPAGRRVIEEVKFATPVGMPARTRLHKRPQRGRGHALTQECALSRRTTARTNARAVPQVMSAARPLLQQ